MKKTIFGYLGAAAVAFVLQFAPANVQAHGFFNNCDPCEPVACNPCEQVCDPCDPNGCAPVRAGQWFLNGYMEAGFFANAHGSKSVYGMQDGIGDRGANATSGNTSHLQNTRLTGAQINQVYLSMGKAVDGRRGLDIGGTVDFTWGSDAYLVQAAGMERGTGRMNDRWGTGDYFAAFSQAYVELAYDRWNVIIGKFHAPFGIDSYKSTENFFYSWSPVNLINPIMGGGAYATYKVNDRLILIGGWVMPEEVGESSKNNAALGGFILNPTRNLNVRYAFAAGVNQYATAPNDIDYFVHSLTATTQLGKRLRYVFDWSYNHSKIQNPAILNTDQYGLNNELIYQLNERWAFGTRFGMLHYDDNSEWCAVSLGANWTPNKWLTVKPEVRYDWTDKPATPLFNGGANTYQVSGGMSAVVKF